MNIKANEYIREVKPVFSTKKNKQEIIINSPEKVYDLFNDLKDDAQEKFIVLHLDIRNKVSCFHIVSIGALNWTKVDISSIARTALITGSYGIICIHNHPSSNTEPSENDIETTHRIKKACDIVGIQLVDHIIIGDGFYSFKEHGLIKKAKE